MFDSSLVVQSAISSFNNAAIAAPSFFWYSVFMLPIFYVVHLFGNNSLFQTIFSFLGNQKKRIFNFALITEILILLWLIVMPGNYEVLRDSGSVLPFIIAVILFLLINSVIHKLREVKPKIPAFLQKISERKWKLYSFVLLLSGAIGYFTGMGTWWGILLQSAAVLSGIIMGFYSEKTFEPLKFTTALIFAVSTIMLMQPEFFRFGQLGNLTILHLLFMFVIGLVSIAVFVLEFVNSRGKIGKKAFIKIKWLFRIMSLIAITLFVLTESVLIFIGLMILFFLQFSVSVWHEKEAAPEYLQKKLWAALLCLFGIITVLPVITILGILYWDSLPKIKVSEKLKFLL